MKFIPRKYRESQPDWFGKRGIPWHVTVAMRKGSDGNCEMLTLCHVFKSCSQDSCAVLSVMSDTLKNLRVVMPQLQSVYYWQDNAGCYHCGNTIALVPMVGQLHGMTVKRIYFCDPQGGKGACDRKSAAIKSHRKVYLNSGNNIETADDMKEAILSFGGMPSVRVTSCGPPISASFLHIKLEGVSLISNVEYDQEGLRVWKAYKISSGKLIPWKKLTVPNSSEVPRLTEVNNDGVTGDFLSVKSKRKENVFGEKAEDEETSERSDTVSRTGVRKTIPTLLVSATAFGLRRTHVCT